MIECRRPGEVYLPNEVTTETTLTVEHAIETSLANNDAFYATLAQLEMAEGDYVQAGKVTNPSFFTVIPVGSKQWEWTLYLPIETFLLRPQRVASTQRELERIGNQLVQNGLALVRDVRVAFANAALAAEQHRLALEILSIRQSMVDLTEKRLAEGEIAELDAIQARVDLLNARANAALMEQNVLIAREQLSLIMGIPDHADKIIVSAIPQEATPDVSVDELVQLATTCRPDLQAAEWAVCAAESRCRLAHKAWWRLDVAADANGSGEKGFEMGPGFRFDIPIFNRNQGGIIRAEAELEAAKYNRDQIRDQIVQQVRLASRQLQQASDNHQALVSNVLPTLEEALTIAENGYKDGATSYVQVLQTTSQYIDSKIRMLDQAAAISRAQAELELSCGRRLNSIAAKMGTENNEDMKKPSQ